MGQIIEISRWEQKTIYTECTITFDCDCTKDVSIPHFCPKDEDEIQTGIQNRLTSECRDFICNVDHSIIE